MSLLFDQCSISILNDTTIHTCDKFDCGNDDLNDFFYNESHLYSEQLLGKSYCFRLDESPNTIICAFTVSNDSVRVNLLPNSRGKKINKDIPYSKQMSRYPAVLIGRLGINTNYKRHGIGTDLMTFIKSWFIDTANKTGCRFLVVDAYNEEAPIRYYQKNGFKFIYSTEQQEIENNDYLAGGKLKTRLMYFDLIELKNTEL